MEDTADFRGNSNMADLEERMRQLVMLIEVTPVEVARMATVAWPCRRDTQDSRENGRRWISRLNFASLMVQR